MTESRESNRRQYYRVQDQVGLEFRRITHNGALADLFEDQATLGLHQELRRTDQDIRQQLASLAERDRHLAFLVKALNHKVDTLARIMAFEQKPLQPEQWHRVTLSEGGIAFSPSHVQSHPSLELGDKLALRLTLLPELQRILVEGEVVDRIPEAHSPQIHIAFSGLTDSDRQTIARHVLRVQARERQEQHDPA